MAEQEYRPELEGTISASQLDTYELCPRKWAWRKVEGIDAPSNASAEFGTVVHSQLEGWLKHATPLNLMTEHGECAMSGLHHLPKPGAPGMVVEGEFLLNGWGHRYYGKKDFQILSGPIPMVGDHKTTSHFKWAKTTTDLPDNIQAALYAADAMVRAGSNQCELRWIYYRSKRPYKSLPVIVTVTRERIEPTLMRVKQLSDEIAAIRAAGLRALELPFNASACEAYGGCAYQENCNLTPGQRLRSLLVMSTANPATPVSQADKDALYERIRQKQAAQGGAGSGVNPPPPPGSPPPPPPNPGGIPEGAQRSPDGKHWWNGAEWQPVPDAPPPPPPPANLPPPPPPAAVIPPPPANLPPPAPAIPSDAPRSPDGKHWWDGTNWQPVPESAPPPPPAAGTPPPPPGSAPLPGAPAAQPKRRGRPPKNATAQAGAAPAADDDPAEEFAAGLDLIMAGIGKLAAAVRAGLFDRE